MDTKRAQELDSNGVDELSAAVGEESSGGAKVRDDMAHEGFADCVCGVATGRDKDGVFGKVIYKYNQESWRWSGRIGPTMSMNSISHGPWNWMVPIIFWRWS